MPDLRDQRFQRCQAARRYEQPRPGAGQLERQRESLKQCAAADRLVVTKTDLVERGAVDMLRAQLGAVNPAAEILASMQTLEKRLDRGRWAGSTTAAALNRLAAELDAASPLDLGTAGFVRYQPDRFVRPFYPRQQRI